MKKKDYVLESQINSSNSSLISEGTMEPIKEENRVKTLQPD